MTVFSSRQNTLLRKNTIIMIVVTRANIYGALTSKHLMHINSFNLHNNLTLFQLLRTKCKGEK